MAEKCSFKEGRETRRENERVELHRMGECNTQSTHPPLSPCSSRVTYAQSYPQQLQPSSSRRLSRKREGSLLGKHPAAAALHYRRVAEKPPDTRNSRKHPLRHNERETPRSRRVARSAVPVQSILSPTGELARQDTALALWPLIGRQSRAKVEKEQVSAHASCHACP